jgi:hypothetical protein
MAAAATLPVIDAASQQRKRQSEARVKRLHEHSQVPEAAQTQSVWTALGHAEPGRTKPSHRSPPKIGAAGHAGNATSKGTVASTSPSIDFSHSFRARVPKLRGTYHPRYGHVVDPAHHLADAVNFLGIDEKVLASAITRAVE